MPGLVIRVGRERGRDRRPGVPVDSRRRPATFRRMRPRAIVFDLDGTLADTLADIADAMNHALAAHGLPTRPADDYRALVGEGVERLVERAVPAGRAAEAPAVLEALSAYYTAHMLDRTQPYPEVPELLDRLAERGVPMAVLSNKPEPATRSMVERMFPATPFAFVAGGVDGVPLKPHPASVLRVADRLGEEPAACAFLGDTKTDMETAVAAGMAPVGALWGFRDRDELERHGARWLLERPLELLDLLDGDRPPAQS